MSKDIIKECCFIIKGNPKSKSNHSLVNKNGVKILPKNSVYALYEKEIVEAVASQYNNKVFEGKVICVFNVYFKNKNKHTDLNNMPKSLCDGIEKSGIIHNDRDIVTVYLNELYDYDNPRVEVEIYDYLSYKPEFKIIKRSEEEIDTLKEETADKKTRKKTLKINEICCSLCGKKTDTSHSRTIASVGKNKKKEHICLKCILVGR